MTDHSQNPERNGNPANNPDDNNPDKKLAGSTPPPETRRDTPRADPPATGQAAPAEGTEAAESSRKPWWHRIPQTLLGGRVRTTTAALVVLFIAALFLYGQRSEHYSNLDEENARNQISRELQPRTTTPPPPETTEEPTTTTTTTPTTTETSVEETAPSTSSSTDTSVPTQTEQPRGGGLIPGLEIPTPSIAR
jgi:hypothetical protein